MFESDYSIGEITTKKWALVSLNLDKRCKSYDRLKNRDYSVETLITDGSLAEIK